MAKLTGQTIADSYDQLLIVDHADGISSSLQAIESADTGGSTSALQISTVGICVSDPTTSSATEGALLRLQSNDSAAVTGSGHRLGIIEFSGEEDANDTMVAGAQIYAIADAAFTATGTYDHATRLEFAVQNGTSGSDGLASPSMTIDSTGFVGIGVADPDATLEILDTTTQLKLSYDATNYATFSIAADGLLNIVTVDPDGAEADICLNPDGNVGIGTAAPSNNLDIESNANSTNVLEMTNTDTGSSATSQLSMYNSNSNVHFGYGSTGHSTYPGKMFLIASASRDLCIMSGNVGIGTDSPADLLSLKADTGNFISLDRTANAAIDDNVGLGCIGISAVTSGLPFMWFGFDDSNVNQFVIRDDGNVGIGTTAPAVKLEVNAASGESWIKVASVANAHAGFLIYQENAIKNYIYHSTTDHLRITDAGDDHGVEMADGETDWTAVGSDARLKTNWELFEDALGKINKLETIGTYQWIDPVTNELTHPNLRNVGFTAQEVQGILPDRIKKYKRNEQYNDDTEYLTFCYSDLFVLAVKAIQELSAKVTALENA